MLRAGQVQRIFHRFPRIPVTSLLSAKRLQSTIIMATVDELTQEVAQQTTLVNKLKDEKAEGSAFEDARKKLGELKKSLALLKNAASGGRETAKKKERLLLKTAKVLQTMSPLSKTIQLITIAREHGIMDQAKCSVANMSNVSSRTASLRMVEASSIHRCSNERMSSRTSTAKTRS